MSQTGPTLTCHSDGASRGNPGPAGAGVVVLDESGRERRAISTSLGEATNNVAEYLALQAALEAAAAVCQEDGLDLARVSVVVKTDSELIAKQVSGEYQVKSPDLAPLLRQFREMAARFYRVQVTHIPREQNSRADKLASQAAGASSGTSSAPGRANGSPARPYSRLNHLVCSRCGHTYEPSKPHGACPSCNGVLLAKYDLKGLVWPPANGDASFAGRPEQDSMWRYHEVMPVTAPQYVVSLGEGLTPLIPLPALERELGLGRVFLKDERLNPTGTFKARGASAAVSKLVELGLSSCAIPTQGNAGSAFAAYSARAGLRFMTAMPSDTPPVIRTECGSYGAEVETVNGLLPDAARLVRERSATEGFFVASTFDEPYRAEGKKTIALELLEAFGNRWPDAILFPVGGGVALVGAWKAAQEMAEIGLGGKPPRLFAIQAEGCAPVVKAFVAERDETELFPNAATQAAGLRVPSPKAGYLILKAIRATGGGAVAVPDDVTLRAADDLRRTEGLNICPEGAAAVAAVRECARRGWLDGCRDVVVVNTGTGLKYPPF